MPTTDDPFVPSRRPVSPTAERTGGRAWLPVVAFALMVLLAAAVLFTALPARGQEGTGGAEINRIVLRVNDQILTLHDYEARKSQQAARILADPGLASEVRQEQLTRLGKQLLKASFDEMLLMSRAKQMSVFVSDDRIEAAIQQVRTQQGLTSVEDFTRALAQSGMTLDQLRDDYRREMTMQELISREVQDRIDLSEDAMRAYYRENQDQFRVAERRQIEEVLVHEGSGLDDRQLREVAEAIVAAASAGASLEEASASYREQGLASEVLDLGWLRAEEIGASLRAAAFATPVGEFSAPIEGRGGLHVLHVVDVEEGSLRGFAEVQDELRGRLQARDFGREVRAYLAELEASAFVREDLPPEAVGFRALADDQPEEQDVIDLFRAPTLPAAGAGEGGH